MRGDIVESKVKHVWRHYIMYLLCVTENNLNITFKQITFKTLNYMPHENLIKFIECYEI